MKKFFLLIPILSVLICLMYVNAGPNVWTLDLTTAGPVWQDCIRVHPTNGSIIFAGCNVGGVYMTTNSGLNWTNTNNGLTNTVVYDVDICKAFPNFMMVGTTNTGSSPGVYKSHDGGNNWTFCSAGITDVPDIQALVIDPTDTNVAYCGCFDGLTNMNVGLFKTTNAGNSWFASNTGIGTIKNILSIAINPKNHNVIYCGTSFDPLLSTGPAKIYKSVNAGATWTDVSTGLPQLTADTDPIRMLSISTSDTSVILAALFENVNTNAGMFKSTNSGASWTKIQSGLPDVAGTLFRSCVIRPGSSTEFYCGLDPTNAPPGGVFQSTNQGASWTAFVGGPLTNTTTVRALIFRTTASDSTLFAGVAAPSGGVYEYSFFPVGIPNQNGNVPKEFALHQNYPNPFNPTTVITYDIAKDANVSISIFDVTGRNVKNVLNEYKKAGTYQMTFNASSLSSGVYFYKIMAGNFVDTKKMILVK